jgi:mannose-6-phosphate isomerase-like protein (cupin superfamily)
MTGSAVNLADKLKLFSDLWAPKVVAEMNDYQLKLVKLAGDFVWHTHDDTDEMFLCLQGEMSIELRDRMVTLRAGELFVVPRGIEHKPRAKGECHVLLIEPKGVVNTGDAGSDRTAPNDEWI